MLQTIRNLLSSLLRKNVASDAANAERQVNNAVAKVGDAEQKLNDAKAEAAQTLDAEITGLAADITAAVEAEKKAEKTRDAKREKVTVRGERAVEALRQAVAEAEQELANDLSTLAAEQKTERDAAAADRQTASDTLARLRELKAQYAK